MSFVNLVCTLPALQKCGTDHFGFLTQLARTLLFITPAFFLFGVLWSFPQALRCSVTCLYYTDTQEVLLSTCVGDSGEKGRARLERKTYMPCPEELAVWSG